MATTEMLRVPESDLAASTEAAYDATVRADIELFRSYAEKCMAGAITDDEFRAQRLRRGIYSQRQAGVHMIRTKIPGGILTAAQMDQLAGIADEFCGGKGHLTTRQNIQYHFVPLPPGSRCVASPGRCPAHHARGLLQHGPQRHRLPAERPARQTKFSTCIPTRRRWRLRSCTKS